MKRIMVALTLTILLMSFVYAGSNVKVNDAEFSLPSKYQGGDLDNNSYRLNNTFSIRCIDENVASAIGLWASEKEFEEDLDIANHPVRHFYQHNSYVNDYHSHAYFASGKSVYEIAWTGKEINRDIENLIKNTSPSEISEDVFYNALDKSINIYKEQKINQLNPDEEYNYQEAKYQSKLHEQQTSDNSRFNQILLTYYNKHLYGEII